MEYPKVGRVTSESVQKGTGKTWDQWIAILEKSGARTWTHQEIVAYLKKKHKLGPWWQQGVAMGYEIATGRRVEGQNAKGEYSLTATKSLHIDVKNAWKNFVSEEGMKIWLQPLFDVEIKPKSMFETQDGYFGEIRTITQPAQSRSKNVAKKAAPKTSNIHYRVRLTWQDPNWDYSTSVEVIFVKRANGNSIVGINHGKIKDLKLQAKLRARWRKALDEFAKKLSSK